jgi:hypothetical protein
MTRNKMVRFHFLHIRLNLSAYIHDRGAARMKPATLGEGQRIGNFPTDLKEPLSIFFDSRV